MFDSPRPANAMSASPNGSASRSLPVRTLALALAATMLPCVATSYAATRHTATHAAAPAHSKAAPARHATVAAKPAHGRAVASKSRTNSELARARAAERSATRPAAATSHRISAAKLRRQTTAEATPSRPAPAALRHDEALQAAKAVTDDGAADRATQDRVHAWYKSRGLAVPDAPAARPATPGAATRPVSASRPAPVATEDDEADDSNAPAPILRVAPPVVAAKAKPTVAHATPDLSTSARKATVADFDHAYHVQAQALRAAQAEAQSRTTADDDAAVASTQIPGTAPTERVAAPFTHGDLLTVTSSDFTARQATLSTPKADTPDKHLNHRTDAEVLAKSADALDRTTDRTTDATGIVSKPNVRAIAEQTASLPTPKLQLPKPVPIARGAAPAVSVVNAAAKKQQIDPQTVAALTEEAFDGDSDPAMVVKSATTLAAKSSKPAPAFAADDDEDAGTRGTTSLVKVNLYDARGKLMLIPPMKGTHEILVHQNQMAVADGLDRIEDDNQLLEMRRYKLLVALPDNSAINVDDRLPSNRRYARPWSIRFLNDLSRAHYARFGTPIIVTSAVRTVEFQKRLVRINGNAAPPTGDVASPHLYGQAIDIAKHGMSVTEIAWMRAYLTPVETEGKIDVEEEFQQACFHVSIYRRYLGLPARKHTTPAEPIPQRTLQQATATVPATAKHRRLPTAILATGLR